MSMPLEEDLERYLRSVEQGDWETGLRIERRYGLDGYPLAIVAEWFRAEIENTGSGPAAIDRALGLDDDA